MNVLFTNNDVFALNMANTPGNRLILVTENAPMMLANNPNVVKMPSLLPPYSAMSSYIDNGDALFVDQYMRFLLTTKRSDLDLIAVASLRKNIVIYTTEDEWNQKSIPFMNTLISAMQMSLTMNPLPPGDGYVGFVSGDDGIAIAGNRLYMSSIISKESFVDVLNNTNPTYEALAYIASFYSPNNAVNPGLLKNLILSILMNGQQDLTPAIIGG